MQVTDSTPARRLTISDLAEGEAVTQEVVFEQSALDTFIELSQDFAAHHTDEAFAQNHGVGGKIIHGFLLASRFSRLLGMYLPGENSVIQTVNLNFRAPVSVGQRLIFSAAVTRVVPAVGAVVLDLEAREDGGETTFVTGTTQCVMLGGD